MSQAKRSPIKDRPLRNPGQSVDDQLDEVLADKFTLPLLVASIAVLLAALEWWRYRTVVSLWPIARSRRP